MSTWNELYLKQEMIPVVPQIEIHKFIKKLENIFTEKPLKIWDLCCGAGRHTVFISELGHEAYGSDESENGINYLKNWLKAKNLKANLKQCDMTIKPWENNTFQGVICWDALHHNTLKNIEKTVNNIYNCLKNKGLFILNLLSIKSGRFGMGKEIEKNTYISDDDIEAGIPHHYFDIDEIKILFKDWKFLILSEQINNYIETEKDFYITNPFGYTKWNLLLEK